MRRLLILLTLCTMCVFSWHIVLAGQQHELTVAFLDVGQGDAIFIQSPTGAQVLVDGGKGSAVLSALASVMPFYDRSIDMLIATHPDADHIGGLIEVAQRFSVGEALLYSVASDTPASEAFASALAEQGVPTSRALRGERFLIGGGAYIDILFPDREAPGLETNTGSVVARLVYGDTSFLLTGDSPKAIEEYLVAFDAGALKSDVLKLGHHGSKTSSSPLFLGFASPEYAVVSAGKDNSYGHPSPEVLDELTQFDIASLSTMESGTVVFTSDGATVWLKNK